MNYDFRKELDKSSFPMIRYGLYLIICTAGFVIFALMYITIENKSILEMVIEYYKKF